MSNPLLPHEPFWDPTKRISLVVVIGVILAVALTAGGELALRLFLASLSPILCLWAPEIVVERPLAGLLFAERSAGQWSSVPATIAVGWILLIFWAGYGLTIVWTGP